MTRRAPGSVSRRVSGVADGSRRRHLRRVWLVTAGTAALAGWLAWIAAGFEPVDGPYELPWVLFIPMVYLAEIGVIHLTFRHDAHSYSMSEVPIVIGLFFADPVGLMAAQLIGNVLALGVRRRQPLTKLAFNLAQFAVQAGITIVAFHGLLGGVPPIGGRGTVAAFSGVFLALTVATTLILGVIRLSGGRVRTDEQIRIFGLSIMAAGMNVSLALVAATVMWASPAMVWAALVPPIILFFAYRAYAGQRQERQRLQALYEVTRIVFGAPDVEGAIGAAVEHSCHMFEAGRSEILLFPDGVQFPGYRTIATVSGVAVAMERVPPPAGDEPWLPSLLERRALLASSAHAAHDRTDLMAVPLDGGHGVVGVFVVAEPLADISSFGPADLAVLDTLAGQVGVALENGRLEDSLVQLAEQQEELRRQALHDALTGLANRALLGTRLRDAIEAAAMSRSVAALLFLDLDDFKTINDTLGHTMGDQVLVAVAKRLEASSRAHDTVARLGGDEFAVLLEHLGSQDDATHTAERFLRELARPFDIGGRTIAVGASLGIAFTARGQTPEEVIRAADQAMYAAKNQRKGSYRVFDDGIHSEFVRRVELRNDLDHAIRHGELELDYQPIVLLETGQPIGLEALIRWRHPSLGLIEPAEFIPVAEETGAIGAIGGWALEESCARAGDWLGRFPGSFGMLAVNLSARQIAETDLVADVRRALENGGLDVRRLVLEITETVLMETSTDTLEQLRDLGVRIAIDDFGTGYSSLGYLDLLPIDILKIDRAFVQRVAGPHESPLLETMKSIGDTLGLVTIAEGIETEAQLERLRALGFEFGQGFLFDRPLPAARVEGLLAGVADAVHASSLAM